MAKKKITEIIEEISAEFLAQNGLELYNSEFVKEGRDWFLRVYIDKMQEAQEAAKAEIAAASERAAEAAPLTRHRCRQSMFRPTTARRSAGSSVRNSTESTRLNRITIWKFPHREWTEHCLEIRILCVLRARS